MNLIDCFYSIQVINTRINTDLVQNCDSGFLDDVNQGSPLSRDVAGSDNICSSFNRRLNHGHMIYKWDEGNDEVVGRDLGIEVSRRRQKTHLGTVVVSLEIQMRESVR